MSKNNRPRGKKYRKDMYEFLESSGVTITPKAHKAIKTIMIQHDEERFMDLCRRLQEANNDLLKLRNQLKELEEICSQ